MAVPKTKVPRSRADREQADRFTGEPYQNILITQVVGSVSPDPDGDQPMLSVAFQVAAEFIQQHGNGVDPIDLHWEFAGADFSAQYYPKRNADESVPMDTPPYD